MAASNNITKHCLALLAIVTGTTSLLAFEHIPGFSPHAKPPGTKQRERRNEQRGAAAVKPDGSSREAVSWTDNLKPAPRGSDSGYPPCPKVAMARILQEEKGCSRHPPAVAKLLVGGRVPLKLSSVQQRPEA